MKNTRYFIADREEASTPYRSITSTLNEKGKKVVFETSHCERLFDGYLEPILSLPTRQEAEDRIRKAGAGDWTVRVMRLTDEGMEGLKGYFDWLEDEWGGVVGDAMGSSVVVSP